MTSIHKPRRRALPQAGAATLAAAALPTFSFAHAPAAPSGNSRIGYQKFNTLNVLKGTGNLEKALALADGI